MKLIHTTPAASSTAPTKPTRRNTWRVQLVRSDGTTIDYIGNLEGMVRLWERDGAIPVRGQRITPKASRTATTTPVSTQETIR